MLIIRISKFLSASAIILLALSANLFAKENEVQEQDYFQANPIIAEINGKIIRFEDLRDKAAQDAAQACLLYTSPSPRDGLLSRMPSSA